ncbi:MAG TPA: hypothetical protein PLJ27_00585 [Polyangiaceae bacterium]|nr:hypothetical protein [Polyangiaceae bacterium]HNZ24531.1 hypothetical protein [Polyangiaceae bacterium]HOD21983.1 hypothetical protein [Polyangiaceae bacterium]HOE47949.1 hypothetical protein [Polyangiaceae bacterium]HOH02592.1 hypothetical protein [Polyangiaceae bacterium]
MSQGDRLTKQELSWLLTQEARAAAKTLRKGVARLSHSPPEITIEEAPTEIESSLDALDDAMRMLDSLNASMSKRGSRGRVDLAALIVEIIPSARVRLEPGSGTEVFGDEGDLRRMVQILVGQTSLLAGEVQAPEVTISREGDEVRVSVALGPETLSGDRTERAWLGRMAIRYGGRLELEGGQESLILPAEDLHDRKEMEALRKELHAAQQQGEAYARELAAVFAAGDSAEYASVAPSTVPPPQDALSPIIAFASGVASQLKTTLASLSKEIENASVKGRSAESRFLEATQTCYAQLHELLSDVTRVMQVKPDEFPALVDVRPIVHNLVEHASVRADRHGVQLQSSLADKLDAVVPPSATETIIRLLLDHGIAATPRGGVVHLEACIEQRHLVFVVDDGGASVPSGIRDALIWLRIDPSTVGRPRGVHLLSLYSILSSVRGNLEIADSPEGGTRVLARIPAP